MFPNQDPDPVRQADLPFAQSKCYEKQFVMKQTHVHKFSKRLFDIACITA